jgi:nitroimidazol reductase NimA-like FMN-containing flavoprotein (pyridoxamine 5'-phosphate oxidase superfamily)/GNAT superfamily N-acetyltransferase
VNRILDEGLVCHVGLVQDGAPVVIPMAYARVDDQLYVHGAPRSRLLAAVSSGEPLSISVTLLDGLVLARSAFHHSMNYRSVVLFGRGRAVTEPEETRRALDALVDRVAPGRSAAARPPNAAELAGTSIAAVPVAEGSAKIREGGPVDGAEDLAHPAWAGVIPLSLTPGRPVPVPEHAAEPLPPHVWGRAAWPDGALEVRRGELLLSTDPRRLDVELVFDFLSRRSYWARHISRDRLERALLASLSVGAYLGEVQVGFARVVTDRATYAYLCDVFVVEAERGRGIGRALVELLLGHPELQGLRRWALGTLDAHGLYQKLGFRPVAAPERQMEIHAPYPEP